MLLIKLLFQGFGFWRLAGGFGGALLGWLLMFGGMQFWYLVEQNLLHQNELVAPEYFIIHKPMPLLNLFGQAGVAFTSNELAEIQQQTFVKAVAPFLASRFKAQATFGSHSDHPALTTELFFEAVTDEFLDVKTTDWHWREGDDFLPIIIPRDYLALYNFGFAQSHNLPQISENLTGQIPFHLTIQGQGKEATFRGRLVGYSQRLNSILVPLDFLLWANTNFGTSKALPLRLIIKTENPSAPQVLRYFTEKNYLYNTEQVPAAKMKSALRILMSSVSAFGFVVLVLAFWVLALSLQLLISRNSERLQKLIWLGYHPGEIVRPYMVLVLALVLLVNVGCLGFLAWGTGFMTQVFNQFGYASNPVSWWKPIWWMGGLSLLLLGLNYLILRKQIYRLA